jgi:hypothetical protein
MGVPETDVEMLGSSVPAGHDAAGPWAPVYPVRQELPELDAPLPEPLAPELLLPDPLLPDPLPELAVPELDPLPPELPPDELLPLPFDELVPQFTATPATSTRDAPKNPCFAFTMASLLDWLTYPKRTRDGNDACRNHPLPRETRDI